MKLFVFAFIIFIISNCSSSIDSIYNSDIILSDIAVKSFHKQFSIKIPVGWFSTIPDDNSGIELWLNNDDFSASIIVTKINFAPDTYNKNQLFEFVKEFKLSGSKPKALLLNEEKFYLGRNIFYAFEYELNQTDIRRTILFTHNQINYEATAFFTAQNQIDEQMKNKLFEIQNSILKSLNN